MYFFRSNKCGACGGAVCLYSFMNGSTLSKERELKDGNDEGRSRMIDFVFYFTTTIKELTRIVSETQIPWNKIAIENMPFFF